MLKNEIKIKILTVENEIKIKIIEFEIEFKIKTLVKTARTRTRLSQSVSRDSRDQDRYLEIYNTAKSNARRWGYVCCWLSTTEYEMY